MVADMMLSLGLAATLATAVQAIMIPPDVAFKSFGRPIHGMGHGMGLAHFQDAHSRIMVVDCAGCAFAQPGNGDSGLTWVQGVENGLVLNFSVGAKPETLELNGVQFYPPVISLEAESPAPYIAQVPATASLVDIKADPAKYTSNSLRLTSWSFKAGTSQTVAESGEEILRIHLQLSALERHPINVPEITIQALKNVEGELMLLKVDNSMNGPHGNLPGGCHDWPLLCKWRVIIATKLHGLKGGLKGMRPHGCFKGMMGGRPHHSINRPPPTNMHHGPDSHHDGAAKMDENHGPPHHDKGPHMQQPGPHGDHRADHKPYRFLHVIGRVVLTVFVPIVLGVAAGMMTYLLGMFIGAVVASFWAKVRPARHYQPISLEEEDVESSPRGSMEKAEFVDEKVDVEAPPQYAEVEGKEIK